MFVGGWFLGEGRRGVVVGVSGFGRPVRVIVIRGSTAGYGLSTETVYGCNCVGKGGCGGYWRGDCWRSKVEGGSFESVGDSGVTKLLVVGVNDEGC